MPKVRGLHLPARPEKVGNAPRNPNCNIIYLKTGLLILYQKCIRYINVANDILTHFRKNRARYDAVKICYGENIRNIHSYEQFGVSSEMEKKSQGTGTLEPFYKVPDYKTGLRKVSSASVHL